MDCRSHCLPDPRTGDTNPRVEAGYDAHMSPMPRVEKELTADLAERIARTALAGVARPWPYQPQHVWTGPTDDASPSDLHPAFCGCYDWHSAVHGHWTLARLLGTGLLASDTASLARRRLVDAITPDAVAAERSYFADPARSSYEWPYGWAWLLTLAAELLAADDAALVRAGDALRPFVADLCDRTEAKLARMIGPVRVGTHANSAFALGLMWDAAPSLRPGIAEHATRWFANDVDYPWAYEPSAYDFLSPGLVAADLMRRVLDGDAFRAWLARYWPALALATTLPLTPVACPDRSDGHLSHLVGLNLSRAWSLARIASAGPERARERLATSSADHRAAGLADILSGDYAGDHWLGSFAVHLLTCGP